MSEDRLDSWKAISAYLKRDVTTVQRWEKREGMPVHRHVHDKLGSVYAYRSELDAWMQRRNPVLAKEADEAVASLHASDTDGVARRSVSGSQLAVIAASIAFIIIAAVVLLRPSRTRDTDWRNPLDGAQFRTITDFQGTEQAAAISRDGKLAAFISQRDGPVDVWLTQIGTGQFYNLTKGRAKQLVNPSVRTLGFSPDGTMVTFWARGVEGAAGDDIAIWAIPTLGGLPRPYLEGVAEFDWTRDGSRLTYHTPGPGDPTFVTTSLQTQQPDPIFSAAPGLHAHFPTWSADGSYIYFVQGTVPNGMDIWRMTPSGQDVERITNHTAAVSHPVLLDDRTLLYLASVGDSGGPRLHAMDLRDRVAHLLGTSLDRYTSLASSSDGRRVLATRTNPKATLWRIRIGGQPAAPAPEAMIAMPTGKAFASRLGAGFVLYVAEKEQGEAIWKLTGGAPVELWSAADAHVIGGPEISSDGKRVAFSVEKGGKTMLYVMNSDGTNVRVVTDALALRGSPAWAPDGESIASGGDQNGAAQLLRVALDGTVTSMARDFAVDPAWSPAGDFVVYSAADIGTEFPVKAVAVSGESHPMPSLTLTRGARRLRFLHGQHSIVALRGDIRHKDVWLIDLDTGKQRQLTQLPADFNIRDFDVSADGRELLVERVQEFSDVVLIERRQTRE